MIYALALFLIVAITISAFWSPERLAVTTAGCMLCSALLGSNIYLFFGTTANVGGVFYAVTLFGLAMYYHLSGRMLFRKMVGHVLTALFLAFGAVQILQSGNMLPAGLHEIAIQRMIAAMLSFGIGQWLFLYLISRQHNTHPLIRYPLILIVVQILSSIVFIPGAYMAVLPFHILVEYTFIGWIMKTLTITATIPFMWVIFRWCPRPFELGFEDPVV